MFHFVTANLIQIPVWVCAALKICIDHSQQSAGDWDLKFPQSSSARTGTLEINQEQEPNERRKMVNPKIDKSNHIKAPTEMSDQRAKDT